MTGRNTESTQPQIEVRNLQTHFYTRDGVVPAVEDVSFQLFKGETLGLVGESGCGKSVTSMSIMRLISEPGRIVGGSILLDGEDLLQLSEPAMRAVRGKRVSMIFQEPMTSLNPVFSIGSQISESILTHEKVSKKEARERSIDMLRKVHIPSPETRVDDYPHQLSGGMRQRVMIAMALSCDPQVLIADEPTTALDVTIQAQIMELLRELQAEFHTSILLITHNLGMVAQIADRIAVMYASHIVEEAPVKELFAAPQHPYTQGLLSSVPRLDHSRDERLPTIPGVVPSPLEFPTGCKFHPRCPVAEDRCRATQPTLKTLSKEHRAACLLLDSGAKTS